MDSDSYEEVINYLFLIGIILVAVSLTLEYKSEKIKNDLIESYKINSEEQEHKNEDNQIEQNIDNGNSNIQVNKKLIVVLILKMKI